MTENNNAFPYLGYQETVGFESKKEQIKEMVQGIIDENNAVDNNQSELIAENTKKIEENTINDEKTVQNLEDEIDERKRMGNILNDKISVVQSSVEAEQTRAKSAEESLQAQINVLVEQHPSDIEQLKLDLNSETERAIAAEQANTEAIAAEQVRAEAKEAELSQAIADEQSRAMSAEQANAEAIIAEQNRAEAKEVELSQAISDEQARAMAAEQANAEAIAAEQSRAEAKEGELSQSISDEANVRGEQDANLHGEIVKLNETLVYNLGVLNEAYKVEQDARISGDNSLDERIKAIELVKLGDLEYSLVVDGVDKGTVNIPKDQFLKSVEHIIDENGKDFLVFSFEVKDSDELVVQKIDISKYIDIYTAGHGLNVQNNEFSIKLDDTTEKYISVSENGLKLFGIDNKIVDVQNNLHSELKTAETSLEAKITNESARATQKETELFNSITAESETSRNAEQANAEAIVVEQVRAEAKEAELSQAIVAEQNRAEGEESAIRSEFAEADSIMRGEIESNFSEEIQNVNESILSNTTLINELNISIDAEQARAEGKEDELAQAIADEQVRAEAKEAELEDADAILKAYVETNYALKSELPAVPTKVSELENDVPYLTEHQSLDAYSTIEYVDGKISEMSAIISALEARIKVLENRVYTSSELISKISELKSGDILDIELSSNIEISNLNRLTIPSGAVVNLNLNGNTVKYLDGDIMFRVNGELVIENGTVDGNGYVASANEGGSITVKSGSYTCGVTCFQSNGGSIKIYDGYYNCTSEKYGSTYTLNCIDAQAKKAQAEGRRLIDVYGGTFVDYNPQNSTSENPVMNFVAEGYKSVEQVDSEGNVTYMVVKE